MAPYVGRSVDLEPLGCRGVAGEASTSQASASSFISSLASHSQIVNTCQPRAVKRSVTARSLARLDANFARQNSGLVDGVVANGHPMCWCQKQP